MPPSHDAALAEARQHLADADRAADTSDPARLGAAAAHAEAAITLLDTLRDARSTAERAEIGRLLAAAWLRRGQAHERLRLRSSAGEVVRSYEQAVAILRELPEDAELQVRRDRAIALINLGNGRQQLAAAANMEPHAAAIAAYDEAIALLRSLPLDAAPELRNSLGAALLNRGAALERRDTPESTAAASAAFADAVAVLARLPLDEHPSFRINLAAAHLNRGRALLRHDAVQAAAARACAHAAIDLVAPLVETRPGAVEIGLQARHLLCRAVADLLATRARAPAPTPDELLTEASDAVDEGLALARGWARRGSPVPPAFVAELFRFGALIYASHQPHFLAEYVLENLDPDASEATAGRAAMLAAAAEIVASVIADYERPRLHSADDPHLERQAATLRDLRAVAHRLGFHAKDAPPPSASD